MKESSNHSVQLKIAVFASCLSFVLGLFYSIFRYGIEGFDLFDVIYPISLSWFIILVPEIPQYYLKAISSPIKKILLSNYFLTSLLLILLAVLGLFVLEENKLIPSVILIVSFLLIALTIYQVLKRKIKISLIFHLFMVIIFGLFIGLIFWGGNYSHPLFFEKISLGLAHVDTLYHISISNMINTYQDPSTGLDGTPYMPYHWASHALFAGMSKLTSIDGITFYNLYYPVIFIPLFLKTFLSLAVEYRHRVNNQKGSNSIMKEIYVIMIFFVGIISPLLGSFPFVSESFTVSFIFLFCLLGLVFLLKNLRFNISEHMVPFFMLLIYSSFLFFLVSFSKISVGFCFMGVGTYILFKFKAWRNIKLIASLIIFSLTFIFSFYLAYNRAYLEGEESSILIKIITGIRDGFHRIDDLGFLFFYMWPFLLLVWFIKKHQLNSWIKLKETIKSNQLIEIESLIVLCVVAFIPGLLVGFNSFYFNSIQIIIGFFLFISFLPQILPVSPFKFNESSSIDLTYNGIIILCLFSFISRMNSFEKFIRDNAQLRFELTSDKNGQETDIKIVDRDFSDLIYISESDIISKRKMYGLTMELKEISGMNHAMKKKSCLFIPDSIDEYYYSQSFRPSGSSFVAPAITGIAMINGMPKEKYLYYGFDTYGLRIENMDLGEASTIAFNKGFEYIIVLGKNEEKYSHEIIKIN